MVRDPRIVVSRGKTDVRGQPIRLRHVSIGWSGHLLGRPPRRAARTDERLSVLSDLALGVAKGASGDFWEQNRDDGLDEDEADVLTASWTLNQGEGVVRRAGAGASAHDCLDVLIGENVEQRATSGLGLAGESLWSVRGIRDLGPDDAKEPRERRRHGLRTPKVANALRN